MRTSILGIPQFHDIETVVNNTKAIAKVKKFTFFSLIK